MAGKGRGAIDSDTALDLGGGTSAGWKGWAAGPGLLSPEWPDRSYLFLESDERISRIEQLRKYYSTLPASPIAAHLRNPLIPVKSRVDWNLIVPMLEDQLNRSPDKMSIPNVTVGEGSDQVSTVILQLDWSRGRTEIVRALAICLAKWRHRI